MEAIPVLTSSLDLRRNLASTGSRDPVIQPKPPAAPLSGELAVL
jgi:hypothetical protein